MRDRKLAPEPAHLADVLLAREVVDHDPGGEEEQCLEERVGDEVEHREPVRAHPGAEKHVADLAHRRVGDHALDVPLDERDDARHEEGREPEERGEVLDLRGSLEDGMRPADEVHAGRHHRRGVDQGRHRRGAFHCVGKPRVERDLGGLRDRAAQQPERDQRHDGVRERARGGRVEDWREVEAPDLGDREEERQRHDRVADRVHDERLLRCQRPRTGARGSSRSRGTRRARRVPSRRGGAGGCRPRRAGASRRRRTPCRRSSGAPRPHQPCSRSSRGRSARRSR